VLEELLLLGAGFFSARSKELSSRLSSSRFSALLLLLEQPLPLPAGTGAREEEFRLDDDDEDEAAPPPPAPTEAKPSVFEFVGAKVLNMTTTLLATMSRGCLGRVHRLHLLLVRLFRPLHLLLL
jgi:hypothetical protein